MAHHRFFFLLSKAHQRMSKTAERECRAALGISVVQLGALMALAQAPGSQQRTLARTLGLNESAINGLVTRMERDGLITRERSKTDRRARELHLTERATALLPGARPLLDRFNDRLSEDFSDDELDTVARFLTAQIDRF